MKLAKTFLYTAIYFLLNSVIIAQPPISLAGKWQVQLDADSSGEQMKFYNALRGNAVTLPGTLDEAGLGTKTSGSDYGILTSKHKYIGPAWYNREIIIPKKLG